jgi:hypothetical protein
VPIGVKILAPDLRDSVLAAREALRLLGPRRVDEGEVVGGMSKKAMLPRLPPPPNAERASRDNGIYSPPSMADVGEAMLVVLARTSTCARSRTFAAPRARDVQNVTLATLNIERGKRWPIGQASPRKRRPASKELKNPLAPRNTAPTKHLPS